MAGGQAHVSPFAVMSQRSLDSLDRVHQCFFIFELTPEQFLIYCCSNSIAILIGDRTLGTELVTIEVGAKRGESKQISDEYETRNKQPD